VPQRVFAARSSGRVWRRNHTTVTVLAVVAGYLVLASTTHIVLLGILPVTMSLTALRRREPFAFVAVVAAAVSVLFAISTLTH
jgi:hypothetical protein